MESPPVRQAMERSEAQGPSAVSDLLPLASPRRQVFAAGPGDAPAGHVSGLAAPATGMRMTGEAPIANTGDAICRLKTRGAPIASS